MARTGPKRGIVVGNYVTMPLLVRAAVGPSQSGARTDEQNALMPFRVSEVCFVGYGLTATVQAQFTRVTNDPINNLVTLSEGTAARVLTADLIQAARFVAGQPVAATHRPALAMTTDGTGAVPKGGAMGWMTGYFTRHFPSGGKHYESGQQVLTGPVAGFYDNVALRNLLAVANAGSTEVCEYIAPYPGRIMAATFDLRNHTQTTGAITVDITKNDVSILSAVLDADANNQFTADALSSPSLVAGQREFAKGDVFRLLVAAGLSDTVPINTLSVNLLVWCKGHVNTSYPAVED